MIGPTLFRFHRLDPALGAEIVDFDLSQPLDDETLAAGRRAFLESDGLLVFRAQYITPEQHVAFSSRFGPLMIHVLRQYSLPGHPEILRISNVVENGEPIGLGDAGRIWHSDLSYTPEPSLGSLLHALELPIEGGDTSFANMSAAYDALPAEIKQRVEGKRAVHSRTATATTASADQNGDLHSPRTKRTRCARSCIPSYATHPETGRKALFVNEGFTSHILDFPEAESRELLEFLFVHSTEARFVYRHRWQDHDLVFWDNRCTIHVAHGCPPQLRRHMHRTTVKGDAPY